MKKIFLENQISMFQCQGGISNYHEHISNRLDAKTIGLTKTETYKTSDIVHYFFYSPSFRAIALTKPKIVTVYDFIPETEKGFRKRRVHMAKNWYIKHAEGVIYISDTVRKQAEALGIKPKIWAVTPLASRYQYPTTQPPRRKTNQVLYVGNRSGYKNFEIIPAALHKSKHQDIELVLVGGKKLSRKETKNLNDNKVKHRHIRSASDTELETLYLESRICLIPSLKEGFGLPMVEAISLGCPVIAMDTDITNEVGGDAVVKISESNTTAWAKAIDSLIDDDKLWESFSKAGIERSKNFSWEKTVELTANLYRRVLDAAGGKAD